MEKVAANAWFMVIGRSAMVLAIPFLAYLVIQLATMDTKLEVLKVVVETQGIVLRTTTTDLYRGTDAIRDGRILQNQVDDVKRRVDVLERSGMRSQQP